MTAWLNMFKKEFRQGLPSILTTVAFMFALLILAAFLGWRGDHTKEAIFIGAIAVSLAHIFYLLFYMINSLQQEKKKLHLWLHNPMSGAGLLLAKLLNGLVAMTITLFTTCTIALLAFYFTVDNTFFGTGLNWSGLLRIGFIILIHIYLIAIYFAILFVFFWVIYLVLVHRIGVAPSIILTLIIFGVLNYIKGQFEATSIYKNLTHWGAFPVRSFISSLHLSPKYQFNLDAATVPMYFGIYIFGAVLTVILFIISCWILDRKVEV